MIVWCVRGVEFKQAAKSDYVKHVGNYACSVVCWPLRIIPQWMRRKNVHAHRTLIHAPARAELMHRAHSERVDTLLRHTIECIIMSRREREQRCTQRVAFGVLLLLVCNNNKAPSVHCVIYGEDCDWAHRGCRVTAPRPMVGAVGLCVSLPSVC